MERKFGKSLSTWANYFLTAAWSSATGYCRWFLPLGYHWQTSSWKLLCPVDSVHLPCAATEKASNFRSKQHRFVFAHRTFVTIALSWDRNEDRNSLPDKRGSPFEQLPPRLFWLIIPFSSPFFTCWPFPHFRFATVRTVVICSQWELSKCNLIDGRSGSFDCV